MNASFVATTLLLAAFAGPLIAFVAYARLTGKRLPRWASAWAFAAEKLSGALSAAASRIRQASS